LQRGADAGLQQRFIDVDGDLDRQWGFAGHAGFLTVNDGMSLSSPVRAPQSS
jgi:hypothetical protein